MKLDKKQVQNFLTIRYNPLDTPVIPPASWQDFRATESDQNGKKSELFLQRSILKSIPEKEKTITISLSSGIDSSLCLALLRKTFPDKKIVAICAVFEDAYDESIIAKKIAQKFEADFKIVNMKSLFSNMPEIVYISKKPRWNTYTHMVAKEAKRHSKIFVTGDGADELFGGYTFRYEKFLTLLKSNNWKSKTKNYLECHNRDWVPDQNEIFGKAIKFDWDDIFIYFKKYFQNPLSSLQQVMLADFNGKFLYDFIPTGKAVSQHYNIQGTPIFQDPDLIKFARHLPIEQKYDQKNKLGKIILRKIAKRLGVEHINEKKGFSPSLYFDWKKNGKDVCKNYILEKNANVFKENLISYDWVLKAFERVEDDGDIRYLNRLIAILALEIWYRLYISKDMNKSKILI